MRGRPATPSCCSICSSAAAYGSIATIPSSAPAGSCGASRRSRRRSARQGWADANRDAVVGYIRAFSEAVDWLYDPRNRDEAVLIFRKNLPNVPEQGAQAAYGVLLAPSGGFQRKAQIDLEGVRTVLQLRSKYAEPKKSLTDPAKYYDASFYQAASREPAATPRSGGM